MKTFEFKNYTLDLKIAGASFQIDCTSELADKMQAHKTALESLMEQMQAEEKDSADAVELCREILNDTLGAEAFERIFAERRPTLTDCSDVLQFVVGEVVTFTKQGVKPKAKAKAGDKPKQ